MRNLLRTACLVIAGAVLSPVISCSNAQQARVDTADVPSSTAVLQPGGVLADGFVVAERTTVPGGVLPVPGWEYDGVPQPDGWSAVVETDLELAEVVAAYAQQALELGFTITSTGDVLTPEDVRHDACESASWTQADEDGLDSIVPRPQESPAVGSTLWVRCGISASRTEGDQIEVFSVGGERSYATGWGGPTDAVSVGVSREFTRAGASVGGGEDSDASTTATTALPPSPPVSSVPPVRTGSALVSNDYVVLDSGSELIGASFYYAMSSTNVLELTGDPDEVFENYRDQIAAAAGFNPWTLEDGSGDFDGRDVRTARISGDDSTQLTLTMLTGDGRPSILWVGYVNGT